MTATGLLLWLVGLGMIVGGLAIFDERVGIGGYDESTGMMQVFVDMDSPIAREWAERVYASVKADSEPLESVGADESR